MGRWIVLGMWLDATAAWATEPPVSTSEAMDEGVEVPQETAEEAPAEASEDAPAVPAEAEEDAPAAEGTPEEASPADVPEDDIAEGSAAPASETTGSATDTADAAEEVLTPAQQAAAADDFKRATISVAAAAGRDFGSQQPWAGLDIGFHADQMKGWSFAGRFRAAYAVADQRPAFELNAGFSGVVPAEKSTIRLGAMARGWMYFSDTPVPLQVGTPDGGGFGAPAFLFGGFGTAEIGWARPGKEKGLRKWSIGVQVGASTVTRSIECPDDPDAECIGSQIAFQGGFTGRMWFYEGVFLELMAGPSLMGGIGYAF
jgi:hypothetical protein